MGGGEDRDRRRLRRQIRKRRPQLGQYRIDDRVCDATSTSMRRASRSCASTTAITASTCCGRPGDHGLARRGIHRQGDIRVVGDQRRGGLRVQLEQRHRALPGQPRHQPRPGGDHPQPVGRAQRPGHHRRGHLPHRMPDHRIRAAPRRSATARSTPTAPPPAPAGCASMPDHRLTGGQHLLQRKPDLLNKNRLQLGHRRGERRLIGQQLPAHPRPLRTLPGIDEHRARPARALMRAHHPRRRLPGGQRAQPGHRLRRDHAHTPWRTCRAGPGDDSGCAPPRPTPPPPRRRPSSRPAPPPTTPPARASYPTPPTCSPPAPVRGTATGERRIGTLLQHHMRVRPTEPERRHPGPPRTARRRPISVARQRLSTADSQTGCADWGSGNPGWPECAPAAPPAPP